MLMIDEELTASRAKCVLLVEDDDAHAEILKTVIARANREVDLLRAVDGESAMDVLGAMVRGERELPDLVLLDLKLPRGSGFEVLAMMKADAVLRSVPVVVLTTSSALGDRARASVEHANSYLVKPLEFTHFERMVLETLDYWLGWHRPG